MTSWLLFRHAVLMVLRNFPVVLRLLILPVAAFVVFLLAGLFAVNTAGVALLMLASIPVVFGLMFVSIAMVVAWHRFILLEERQSGILPRIHVDRVWAYLGRLLLLSLIFFVSAIAFAIFFAILGSDLNDIGNVETVSDPVFSVFWLGLLGVLMFSIGMMYLTFRWSPMLPAAAIGKHMSLSEAWEVTKPISGSVLGMVVLLVIFNLLSAGGEYLVGVMTSVPHFSSLWTFLFSVVYAFVSASAVTTIYGYTVEGRSLS